MMRGNRTFKKIDRWAGIPILLAASAIRKATRFLARTGHDSADHHKIGSGDRILIIKQSALGDTLLLLPVLKAMRGSVGSSGQVDMLVTPVNSIIAENCPWMDDIILFDPSKLFLHPLHLPGLVRKIRSRRYTVVLDFDQWLRSSALLAAVSGAATTAGFKTPGQHRHFASDLTVTQTEKRHESCLFRDLACSCGIPVEAVEPFSGFLKGNDLFESDTPDIRDKTKPMRVLFHPGCGEHGYQREWPAADYASLGSALSSSYDISITISGHGEHEMPIAREIIEEGDFNSTDLSGRLTFAQLAAVVKDTDLVVCGNTGVMHLAAGYGTPLVALHGPTDHLKWGPDYSCGKVSDTLAPGSATIIRADIPCSPCLFLGYEYGCDGRACMESIQVETVLDACSTILDRLQTL
ncbi:MAG: glycosyltransferase family 9 protein [Bacteroidales bacterium]|nr:glycosyltransferase family 9 protein [Candidatus Latescibacterota bacterium]